MTPPPSREPGQADAALEADIAAFLTEMEHWNNPPRDAALTLRILADRTQREKRIGKLEEALPDAEKLDLLAEWIDLKYPDDARPEVQNDLRSWANRIRAALEVPDAE